MSASNSGLDGAPSDGDGAELAITGDIGAEKFCEIVFDPHLTLTSGQEDVVCGRDAVGPGIRHNWVKPASWATATLWAQNNAQSTRSRILKYMESKAPDGHRVVNEARANRSGVRNSTVRV